LDLVCLEDVFRNGPRTNRKGIPGWRGTEIEFSREYLSVENLHHTSNRKERQEKEEGREWWWV